MKDKTNVKIKSKLSKILVIMFSILFIGSVITIFGNNTAKAEDSHLVGYWNFDEGTGTIAIDVSGNGNTGTLINSPAWVDGKYGNAISFTGTNYITVPDSQSLDMTSQVTLEAWVYPRALVDSSNYDSHVVSRCDSSDGGHRYEFGTHSSGRWHYSVLTPGLTNLRFSTSSVVLNTWTHVAMTYDGSMVRFYINGQLDSSHAQSGSIMTTTSPMGIGVKTSGPYGGLTPAAYFNGIVDEVGIYDIALTQQEIQSDMLGITPPVIPLGELVAYWSFNEGSGAIAVDSSGKGNTGTLVNIPNWVDGKSGKALSFSGANYVQVPDSSSLDVTYQVTLEAWVYPRALVDSSNYDSHVVSRCDSSDGGHRYEFGTHSSGRWHYSVLTPGLTNLRFSTSSVVLNTWTHVAMTYDGSMVRFYINGQLDSSHAQSGRIITTTSPLGIGVKTSGPYGGLTPAAYFNGIIDEVRIYSKALTQQEIQTDMLNVITPPETSTKGTPGFETAVTIASMVTVGALVAFFRRRNRIR